MLLNKPKEKQKMDKFDRYKELYDSYTSSHGRDKDYSAHVYAAGKLAEEDW